jgi:hypothetical protein
LRIDPGPVNFLEINIEPEHFAERRTGFMIQFLEKPGSFGG